jgi:hypothetical protein
MSSWRPEGSFFSGMFRCGPEVCGAGRSLLSLTYIICDNALVENARALLRDEGIEALRFEISHSFRTARSRADDCYFSHRRTLADRHRG